MLTYRQDGEKRGNIMNINVSKKDEFNGKNSALKAEDFLNVSLKLNGLFDFNDDVVDKETGEAHTATLICLVTDKGCISSPSKTLIDSAKKLVETFEDDVVGLDIMIVPSKSNAGRTFYRIELV